LPEHELRPVLVPVAVDVGRVGFRRTPRQGAGAATRPPGSRRVWFALALAAAGAAGAVASVALVHRSGAEKKQGMAKPAPSHRVSSATPTVGKAVSSPGAVTVSPPALKRARTSRGATATGTASTVAKLAPPVAAPPPGVPRAPTNARPLALGGYVSGRTHVLVSADARTLTSFVIAARCAPKTALPPVAVRRDGSFRFAGVVAAKPRTTVTLGGRFVDTATARLSVRFLARGCDSGLVRMTLRLS
jgi:hypothetical protein